MITYKLIRQLKEAGFPLIELENYRNGEVDKVEPERLWGGDEVLKYKGKYYQKPFLDELIEALGTGKGDSIFRLVGSFTHDFCWIATWTKTISMKPSKIEEWEGWGLSPEEAVVNLWLNKKDD